MIKWRTTYEQPEAEVVYRVVKFYSKIVRTPLLDNVIVHKLFAANYKYWTFSYGKTRVKSLAGILCFMFSYCNTCDWEHYVHQGGEIYTDLRKYRKKEESW